MSNVITVSGKGGSGKTTTMALLLDELARFGYTGRVLVVDGDPAMTLHLALDLPEPLVTVAGVRDQVKLDGRTLRHLPQGMTPSQYVMQHLQTGGVLNRHKRRHMRFDLLALGWGEGSPGCYCQINNLLAVVLSQITAQYDLVLVDNEAGVEHLSRYRLKQVDLFLTVLTDNRAAQVVAERVLRVAVSVGMDIREVLPIHIVSPGRDREAGETGIRVPYSADVAQLMMIGPVTALDVRHPVRLAMRPLVERVLALGGYDPTRAHQSVAAQIFSPVEAD